MNEINEIEEPLSAHKRGEKIQITMQAINKIKLLNIDGVNEKMLHKIHKMNKDLLKYSMLYNDSNEVGCVLDIADGSISNIVKGDVSTLELRRDTGINHKYLVNNFDTLVVSHNHPGLSNFSINDLNEFLNEKTIKAMIVVKNNGSVVFVNKTENINISQIRKEYTIMYKKYVHKGQYDKFVKEFLKKSVKYGIQKG